MTFRTSFLLKNDMIITVILAFHTVRTNGQISHFIIKGTTWLDQQVARMSPCRTRGTLSTFNSCTKSVGSPGITHDRTPKMSAIFQGMVVWMTSQLNVALIYKLRVSLMCLSCFLTC